MPVIMSTIGRLKPTTTVTITSKCAVQSHPNPQNHFSRIYQRCAPHMHRMTCPLSAHAYRMLICQIGACNLMLCPVHVFRPAKTRTMRPTSAAMSVRCLGNCFIPEGKGDWGG